MKYLKKIMLTLSLGTREELVLSCLLSPKKVAKKVAKREKSVASTWYFTAT